MSIVNCSNKIVISNIYIVSCKRLTDPVIKSTGLKPLTFGHDLHCFGHQARVNNAETFLDTLEGCDIKGTLVSTEDIRTTCDDLGLLETCQSTPLCKVLSTPIM